MDIATVRQKYPQYSDLSDTQLADALHSKFYADMDKPTFYGKIGLKQSAPQAENESGSAFNRFVDENPIAGAFVGAGGGLVKAATGAIQGVAQAVGADGVAEAAGRSTQQINRNIEKMGTAGKVGAFAGEIAPYLAVPAGGATMVGRAALGAASGATQGALQAQENPDGGERVKDAIIGGLTGLVAPVAIDKAVYVAKGAGSAVRNAVKSVQAPAITDTTRAVLGDVAGGVDDVGRNSQIQTTLKKGYESLSRREDAVWNKVRTEAAQSAVSPQQASGLVDELVKVQGELTSNDAAGVIDRQIARLGRFIANNQEVPAAEVIGIRQTLSKASRNDGGLYRGVQATEDFINTNLQVPSLKPALNLSRQRFTTYEGPKVVAAAIEDGATPERFGRALFGASSPANAVDAGTSVQQVLKAAGKDKAKTQALIDQSVSHRILQLARQNDGEKIWIGKAANEITNLRSKNPSLWKALSPESRNGLVKLETAMRRDGEAGALNKVGDFALNLVSRTIRPLGINTGLRLPSIASPKTVAEFDEVLRYLAEPEVVAKAAKTGLTAGKTVTSAAIGGVTGLEGEKPAGNAPTMNRQREKIRVPVKPTVSGTSDEEGFSPRVYKDTVGKRTVGIGFNMQQPGARQIWEEAGIEVPFNDVLTGRDEITEQDAERLHEVMMDKAASAAPRLIKGVDSLSENRQAVIRDMLYQLGEGEARKFAPTFKLIEKGRFAEAAARLQKAKIASQAPNRVARNAYMLEHNVSREEAEKALVAAGKIKANGRLYG
jgi:lysozyme